MSFTVGADVGPSLNILDAFRLAPAGFFKNQLANEIAAVLLVLEQLVPVFCAQRAGLVNATARLAEPWCADLEPIVPVKQIQRCPSDDSTPPFVPFKTESSPQR